MRLSAPETERLTRAVELAESKTSIEVVLAILPRSRGYLTLPIAAAALVAFLVLGLTLFLEEPEIAPGLVVPIVGLTGLATFVLTSFLPATLLAAVTDRRSAVDTAAHAAFSRYGVHRTSGRTGLLVFLSLAEREARIVADQGVLSAVPADVREDWVSRLNAIAAKFDVELLAKELEAVGVRAGGYLPRAADDVDELPNAPVLEEEAS